MYFKKASLSRKAKKEKLCVCLSVCGSLNLHKNRREIIDSKGGSKVVFPTLSIIFQPAQIATEIKRECKVEFFLRRIFLGGKFLCE